MSQITWRNVNNGSGAAAANTGYSNGVETILGAFDPLEKVLKDRANLEEQNWDAKAKQNTQEMKAQLQKAQNIGEFNKMQADGAFSEDAFYKQYGAQYDPSQRKETLDSYKSTLQNNLKNALYTAALAHADENQDRTAGALFLQNKAREQGAGIDFAQELSRDFMKNTQARDSLYKTAKKENLISAMSEVDFNVNSTVDDVTDQLAAWQDAGLNVDYEAAQNALDKKRIGVRDDWSQEKKVKEYNRGVQQRELKKNLSSEALKVYKNTGGDSAAVADLFLNSGLDDPLGALANVTPALAQSSELSDVEQYKLKTAAANEQFHRNEIKTEQDNIVATQQKQIDGMIAFPTERYEYLKNNVKTRQDAFASHDFNNSDIDKNNIQEGMEVLRNNKNKLDEKDAAIVMAMSLEQMKGADKAWIQPDWLDGDIEQNFNKLLTKNAAQYRKREKAQTNLNNLSSSFAKEQKQWQKNHTALTGARILAASKSKLKGQKISPEEFTKDFGIDSDLGMSFVADEDERVRNYKKSYIDIIGSGDSSNSTNNTSTDDAEKNLKSRTSEQAKLRDPVTGKNVLEQLEDSKQSFISGNDSAKNLVRTTVIPAVKAGWSAHPANLLYDAGVKNFRKTIDKNLKTK